MKKVLKTIKNVSWSSLLVRNSDGVKKEVANNKTFVSYKAKELLRLYSSYFTVVSEEPETTEVYKVSADDNGIVSIVNKRGAEIISMKVETVSEENTFYLWIGGTRKADDDSDTIELVSAIITSVVNGVNILEKEDADTLVEEYNSLS